MPIVERCEYRDCQESLVLVECKPAYDTYYMYCPEHASLLGYCVACGYKFDGKLIVKNENDNTCQSCQKMQKEALEQRGWID